ncbi:unnamed protein product [Brassicogethes aeneus]|uniref:BHLH domain-containing protein n=1 Tax=Brassicogethes aeneus TaxID=1431903 RepID=A0A9P0BDM7_BRAAE|nr:unnamed protein product [Brassicogethes aeneus]
MSSISVVQYTPASPNKLSNVLQQNNNASNKREVIVLRKPAHILPQPEDFKDNILITNTARKKSSTKPSNKANPQPVAVARRNARERNRVKQVNNGFANLRQHIPNFIAQAFETNTGRGGNKKLSKVETLRMAVEYIRSLEEILAMDGVETPTMSTLQTQQYNNYELSPSDDGFDEDDMSLAQTPPPQQQFIKINTSTNTYQIIPGNIYDNSENMDPLIINNHIIDTSMMDPNLEFTINQDLSYLSSNYTTASLSPGMYSDQSLSPNSLELSDRKCYIPVFNSPNQDDIKVRLSPDVQVKNEETENLPVISLKTEQEVPDGHKDNVIDVIQWWEQQQPPTSRRS